MKRIKTHSFAQHHQRDCHCEERRALRGKARSKPGDSSLCSEQAPQSQKNADCHALWARNDVAKVILFLTAIILTTFYNPPSISQAASPELIQSLTTKLESWDVEDIWPEVKEALAKEPRDPQLLEIASQIAFHRGDYQESLKLMKLAMEVGGEDDTRRGYALLTEETIHVLNALQAIRNPPFRDSSR